MWFLDVNGKRIELDTESLFNQLSFQKACVEKLNVLPPAVRKQDWEQMLNALLTEMVETEQITVASEDTTVTGQFNDLLEEFCTHLQQAMDRDEILLGRPWTNDDGGRTYFRMKDLNSHLVRNNFKGMSAILDFYKVVHFFQEILYITSFCQTREIITQHFWDCRII